MTKSPLVSIIMPAYNSEKYIGEAIDSVFKQTYIHWELIIVNDGSTDRTERKILNYQDRRIRYFSKENGGVGSARNIALKEMKGDFFCFLDADDVLPTKSLEVRLDILMKDESIAFVSGKVVQKNANLSVTLSTQIPTFKGFPKREIIRLNPACLVAITWMIRRAANTAYHFPEEWTHSEDVAFFLSISEQGKYDYTKEEVLTYRRIPSSAMSNLRGLEDGYVRYYKFVVRSVKDLKKDDRVYLKKRIIRIMFLSYLANKNYLQSVQSIFRLIAL